MLAAQQPSGNGTGQDGTPMSTSEMAEEAFYMQFYSAMMCPDPDDPASPPQLDTQFL